MAEDTASRDNGSVAKALRWPIVAIAFLLLFQSPIRGWLGNLGQASEITVGALAIKFTPNASPTQTWDASPEIASAVSQLRPGELDFLLGRPPNQMTTACALGHLRDMSEQYAEETWEGFQSDASNWAKLESLQLVASQPADDREWCEAGGMRSYELTDLGTRVRSYVSYVATQILKFEKRG